MARALDWGDQYPSDLDDTPPTNPTDGFEEKDYNLLRVTGAGGLKGANPRHESPDLQTPFIKEQPRISYTAVITAYGDVSGTYTILRQDGRTGTATTRGDDRVYQQYRIGDYVKMTASQQPDVYFIQGAPRNKEYAVLDIHNTEDVGPTNTMKDVVFTQAGIQTIFNEDEFFVVGGGIKLKHDKSALYEIHYTAVVVCVDPDTDNSKTNGSILMDNPCGPTQATTNRGTKTKQIGFMRNVGFKVTNTAECKSVVTLKVDQTDYVPQAPAGGGDVVWTNEPWISSAIKVGTTEAQGWVKIECSGPGKLWLGHGNTETKLLFPDAAPSKVSFLYVAGYAGSGVKLGWTPTPGCGTISVVDYYGTQKQWIVQRGLIMSGPGITPCDENQQFVLQEPERKIWSC